VYVPRERREIINKYTGHDVKCLPVRL